MIRKETLTSYDAKKWNAGISKPTAQEIDEMCHMIAPTFEELSNLLNVATSTIQRWRRVGIGYSDWALLASLAGYGDIVRPETCSADMECKIEQIASLRYKYFWRKQAFEKQEDLIRQIEAGRKKRLAEERKQARAKKQEEQTGEPSQPQTTTINNDTGIGAQEPRQEGAGEPEQGSTAHEG